MELAALERARRPAQAFAAGRDAVEAKRVPGGDNNGRKTAALS